MKKVYVKASEDNTTDEYINSQIDRFCNYINRYNAEITSYLNNIITEDLEDSVDDISYIIDDIDKMKKYAEMIYKRINN